MINRERFPHSLPDTLFTLGFRRWMRYIIIFGVFLLSLTLGIRPNLRLLALIGGMILVVVAAVILIRQRHLGILAIVIASFLIPTPASSGIGSKLIPPILIVIILFGLWFIDMLVRERRISFVRSRTLLPAIVLLIVAFIAFINGQINYYSFAHVAPLDAQVGGLAIFIISIVAFLLVGNTLGNVKWLERTTWLFLIIGAVYIFLGRLIPLTERFIRPLFAYGSTDSASIFWIWLVCMASSQALFNRQLNKAWRGGVLALALATLFVGLVQAYDWKSGWVPAMIALFVVIWIGYPRFRVPGTVLGFLLGFIYIYVSQGTGLTEGENYSILTRLPAWTIVLEIVKANPLLGLGFSNYYWYTPLFPILGYISNFNSHNNYIDIIAQVGLIGLGCFLWFMWEVGRLGWELRHEVPDGFSYAYVIGVLGGLVGTLASGMLGDWFLPFVYNVGLNGTRSSLFAWLFLGGLVALERIYRNSPANTPTD
jgi:hypothetical protein